MRGAFRFGVWLLCGSALLASCGGDAERPRAVVIGIDSADWRVMQPLLAGGARPAS